VDRPQTRFAVTDDDVHIAYQVIGDGPVDVVSVHAFISHLEWFWDLPSFERFISELSSWARVVVFDKRGVGLSDRLSVMPTLEVRGSTISGPSWMRSGPNGRLSSATATVGRSPR
jgi:pimeloyl-ACP methyl ester carboxylesterase